MHRVKTSARTPTNTPSCRRWCGPFGRGYWCRASYGRWIRRPSRRAHWLCCRCSCACWTKWSSRSVNVSSMSRGIKCASDPPCFLNTRCWWDPWGWGSESILSLGYSCQTSLESRSCLWSLTLSRDPPRNPCILSSLAVFRLVSNYWLAMAVLTSGFNWSSRDSFAGN